MRNRPCGLTLYGVVCKVKNAWNHHCIRSCYGNPMELLNVYTLVKVGFQQDTQTLTRLIGATQLSDTSLATEEGEVKRQFQFISLNNSNKCRIEYPHIQAFPPGYEGLGTMVCVWGHRYEGLGTSVWVRRSGYEGYKGICTCTSSLCVWPPPLTEVLCYSTSNTVMRSNYATEQCLISTQDCHI